MAILSLLLCHVWLVALRILPTFPILRVPKLWTHFWSISACEMPMTFHQHPSTLELHSMAQPGPNLKPPQSSNVNSTPSAANSTVHRTMESPSSQRRGSPMLDTPGAAGLTKCVALADKNYQ